MAIGNTVCKTGFPKSPRKTYGYPTSRLNLHRPNATTSKKITSLKIGNLRRQ